MLNQVLSWYKEKRPNTEIRTNFGHFRTLSDTFGRFRIRVCNYLIFKENKKRPNTIPVFGPGKWLLGESRALKVGINAG
ncbi:hypothetical protein EBH53_22355 [Salmonella enterica]|nr:hypothetical protein [Salmonella enterica]EAN2266512.1 hypothetical protein [Salmonella enterica]